ncbi:MAG: glycosyltransferase family 39 protein [Candidatus Nealsonbacteria bacterium]|nr:glycosyltransferase family 39 protein [Candidatus Nealsonbacteria bacterium]
MKNLIQNNRFLTLVLISLLFFQLIYSFLFPAAGFNDNWLPVADYLPKFRVESSDSFLLEKVYPLIPRGYRLNSDVGHYLELAKDFTPEYFKNHVLLSRPLYSFLVFSVSLPGRFFVAPSYGIIFGLAILVNFILMTFAVLLFFGLLKKIFSLKTAFLSSVLLIFSPFSHASILQPRAEILTVFSVVASAYLLYNYAKKPSTFKLAVFSLVIGVFMLAKMFFALPLFIILLAVYLRRYKEGFAFFVIHLIPFFLWYLFVTQVWRIPFYIHEIQYYGEEMWIFKIFQLPWQQTYKLLLESLPNFIKGLIYSFLLIPVIFSVIGLRRLRVSLGNILYLGPIFSVFLLSLFTNTYYPRIIFLLFPIIYPTCVLGIDRAANFFKNYQSWLYPIFYVAAVGFIIVISNINIYQIFYYL